MYQLQIYGSTIQWDCQGKVYNIYELLFDKTLHIAIAAHALERTPPKPQGHPKVRPTLLSRTSSPRSRAEGPRPAAPRRTPLLCPYLLHPKNGATDLQLLRPPLNTTLSCF